MYKKIFSFFIIFSMLPFMVFGNIEIEEIEIINFEYELEVYGGTVWYGYNADGGLIMATNMIYVGSGLTECGQEFQVFKPYWEGTHENSIESFSIGDSMSLTRTVVFPPNSTPSPTIWWTENINGRTWAGTLHLVNTRPAPTVGVWGDYHGVVTAP